MDVYLSVTPSPIMIEATSTMIYSAPYIPTKGSLFLRSSTLADRFLDLDTVRTFLIQRLGPDFARSATGNRDSHVSQRALRAISPPIPSAAQLDAYMKDIAQSHNVVWIPDPPRQSVLVFNCPKYICPCI